MNRFKGTIIQISLAVIFAVCLFLIAFIIFIMFQGKPASKMEKSSQPPVKTSAVLKKEKKEESIAVPVRIKIPKLGVETKVEHVGLAKRGEVGAPKGADNTAWFKLGPRPGEKGTAIIDGHAGYRNNQPAVFDNLHKLEKGDKIYVKDKEGKVITFVVRGLKSYGRKESAEEVFLSDDGFSHLNLITCTGDWNALEKTRSSRLVVFADRLVKK